ncbi:MAG: hypothetical protein EZS28_049677, partial [Streblomastix strix]
MQQTLTESDIAMNKFIDTLNGAEINEKKTALKEMLAVLSSQHVDLSFEIKEQINLCSQVILILGVRNSNEKDISSGTPDNKMNEFGMQMLMKLVEESYKNGDEQTGQFAIQIAYELLQCTSAEMKFDLNKSAYKQKILLGIKIATSCVKIIGVKKINSDVVEMILQFSETEEDDIFAAYSIFMRVWKQKEGFSVDTLSKVGQQKKIIELEDKVRREE